MGVALCKPCTLPELEAAQPLTLKCDTMTDEQTSDENQAGLDPITELAKELDALKSELSDIKNSYAKLAADNSALLESNRRLLGELGKMVSPPEVKPPEKSAADIAYESFMRTIGIER